MELSGHEEGDSPIPINTSYGVRHGHHMIHHDPAPHIIIPTTSSSSIAHIIPSNGPMSTTLTTSSQQLDVDDDDDDDQDHHVPYRRLLVVRYRECLKNHAASMGGNATDGCGEFMPSGEEGTLEALTCSACNCHRNFHRKEVEGEPSSFDSFHHYTTPQPPPPQPPHLNHSGSGRKLILPHHKNLFGSEAQGYPTGTFIASRPGPGGLPHHHQMIMSYNMGCLPSESDEQEEGGGGGCGGGGGGRPRHEVVKKRFRTKFSQEQKEKMLDFAEKVGWKIQKQEEGVVQQFCQEIGVKRRVLKVWMHNNKHNVAKKEDPSNAENPV
ncbi:hypothetical protein U1Q18_041475 [Sarracenia purpurea var. burkii]